MKKFTADFETSTWEENKTRVWAWAICEINNEENLQIGNNIDDFIEYCKNNKNCIVYFHNLKFDGSFLIYWAFTHGFTHVQNKEDIKENTFTTLISDLGQFYQICFYFSKGNKTIHKVTFIDSLKIIPFSVDETAKCYGLSISKLKIDYNKPRKIGHILTQQEKEYIKNDVVIMAKAMKIMFEQNLTKMTRASCAISDYKEILTLNKFNHYFPKLDFNVDKDIRQSYKGGFTYLNPIYKEKDIEENIINLDINSLYPYVMYSKMLPYGDPMFYEGKYENDIVFPLYIQQISCCFKVKKNKIPTIQIKNSMSFIANEYLESSNDEIVTLVLTNIDLEMFFKHYDVWDLTFECGWKFHAIKRTF